MGTGLLEGFFSLDTERVLGEIYSLRILVPPPVPVTHPKCQNTLQRLGIRLAGWLGSSDLIRWSLLVSTTSDGVSEAILMCNVVETQLLVYERGSKQSWAV